MTRRVLGAGAVAVGLAAMLLFLVPAQPNGTQAPDLGRITPIVQSSAGSGACDVTGVTVSYDTTYRTSPTLGYYVTGVLVHDISWPSCNGAALTVSLTDAASQTIGTGQTPVAGSPLSGNVTTTVPMSPQPDAAIVTGVQVTLAGGTTPIPDECKTIKFDFTSVGTLENDAINGTNKNDLIYTLEGIDRVEGFNGTDCITGGPGVGDDTTIIEGNGSTGDNVVLAGHGSDTVTVGNGDNLIKLGNGNDTVTAGSGANTIYLGTGTSSITVGNGNNTIFTGGRTSSAWPSGPTSGIGATAIKLGNGNNVKVYGGNGNDTIYLGTGKGTVDGGGGTNVCHVPMLKNSKYTIVRCTVVAP